ncbi:hypothetical protein EDWATA_03388 [Edwardsiella tarda ATCC 23685]|uniref:Uncharacterized protein n=1 Tax=Edwardsiella tarda ATCC 23685 TaxID=500638 RepID=D4F9D0_EDWTA|nr:hypothetical protein EDWATA_03388 [Edwardsiella tarda ATCC 23685]
MLHHPAQAGQALSKNSLSWRHSITPVNYFSRLHLYFYYK